MHLNVAPLIMAVTNNMSHGVGQLVSRSVVIFPRQPSEADNYILPITASDPARQHSVVTVLKGSRLVAGPIFQGHHS